MKGFSKAILAGNLTRDPELRTTPSGAQSCSFAIAVNRPYRDGQGNSREQVSFFNCTAWGRIGEVINQYMQKGSPILVSGRLEQRSWDDKNTGQRRTMVEVTVEDFTFLGGRGSEGDGGYAGGSAAPKRANAAAPVADAAEQNFTGDVVPDDVPTDQINLDDIPF